MAHRGTLHPGKALDLVSKVLLLSQLDRIATLVAHLSFFCSSKKKKILRYLINACISS